MKSVRCNVCCHSQRRTTRTRRRRARHISLPIIILVASYYCVAKVASFSLLLPTIIPPFTTDIDGSAASTMTDILVSSSSSSYLSATTATPIASSTLFFWLRATFSAITTYGGFVLYCDRPRGGPTDMCQRNCEVGPSTIGPNAGLGLFAKTDLPKGTVLGTYPGVVLPITAHSATKLKAFPQCEGYTWRFSDNKYVIDPTDPCGNIQDYCVGGSSSQFGSVWLFHETPIGKIVAPPVSTTLCRINEPPIGKTTNVQTVEDADQRTVTFELERDVIAGDELFIDYGLYYDRSNYGGGADLN